MREVRLLQCRAVTQAKQERRSPDRPRVMLRLLRRLAVVLLVLAAAVIGIPRALDELGLVGPSVDQRLGSARQMLTVARSYGATAELEPLAAAEKALASAEALHTQGRRREARVEAEEALRLAAEAQHVALVRRDSQRIRAKEIVDQLDRRIDELEDLYAEKKNGLPKQRVSELLSRMKQARATAAALILAWEQQDYASVLKGEGRALAMLEDVKKELQAAG
jgi:hypothetical protein